MLDRSGRLLARVGREVDAHGQAPGQFQSPHGIAIDSRGDLYVGEAAVSAWPSLYPGVDRPGTLRCLQKLERVT